MIRRVFNICSFALLKANKIRPETVLSLQQLNGCRELFKIKGSDALILQQNSQGYLKQRAETFINSNPDEIIRRWEQLRPIECEVNVLTFSTTYSLSEKKYVDSLIRFWSGFFLSNRTKFKDASFQKYKQALKDYINVFNNLIYLMTMNSGNLFLYLHIYNLIMELKITNQKYFSSLRYIFDGIITLPLIQKQKIDFLIFFTSKHTPHLFYFTREQQIWDFIYKQIPEDWTSNKHQKMLVNILYSLTINSRPPKHLVQQLPCLLKNTQSSMIKYRTFCFMVEFYMINKDNIRLKRFLEPLKVVVKEIPQKSMRSLAKMFYRAQIWVPQFWQPYFSYMSMNNNYKQIDNVDHHIIDDLLANGEGGHDLKIQALKFRGYLKSKGLDIVNLDCKVQLEKLFGRIVREKSSCQQVIANCLRLICKAEIVTQVSIKYFQVDIVVDKKIAIEINSGSHYKYIDGTPVLNLKSSFRQRILERQGYVCRNIHVEDFSLANYFMMDDIYKIIESSIELKAKLTQPRRLT